MMSLCGNSSAVRAAASSVSTEMEDPVCETTTSGTRDEASDVGN